jgi:hypothetical protein
MLGDVDYRRRVGGVSHGIGGIAATAAAAGGKRETQYGGCRDKLSLY